MVLQGKCKKKNFMVKLTEHNFFFSEAPWKFFFSETPLNEFFFCEGSQWIFFFAFFTMHPQMINGRPLSHQRALLGKYVIWWYNVQKSHWTQILWTWVNVKNKNYQQWFTSLFLKAHHLWKKRKPCESWGDFCTWVCIANGFDH